MFQMDGEKPEPIVIQPAETNIVPKNQWLEDQTPCGRPPYQGRTVSFREVAELIFREWRDFLLQHLGENVGKYVLGRGQLT